MSLENANGIWQLIITNPTTQDFVSQGDDHLRMLKRAIINTFPNIKGPVTVTHSDLNNIPTSLAGKIEALALNSMPQGGCMVWDILNKPQIPAGWSLCNGQTVEGYGVTPDMRNLFVKGWNGSNNGGTTGGSSGATTSNAGSHTHEATSGPATLTESQLPVINFGTKGSYAAGGYDGGSNTFFRIQPGDTFSGTGIIAPVGGGQPHSHPGGSTSAAPDHSHTVSGIDPPHYIAVWIVKTSALVLPT
jgi:hypothetical protein